MSNLLAIEWLKIKKNRTFWILMGLFFLLLPLFNYMISSGLLHLGGRKNGFNVLSTVYSFPGVWSSMGFWGSIFINFMAILVIIITTNEFEFRTNRQNIIDGWERMDFLNGKILIVLLLSLVVTLYVFLTGLVFGRVTGGSFNGAFSGIAQVGYFFILSLDYMGFGLLLALLIRKSGLAIGLFLLYSLIIENIIVGSVNHFTNKPWGNLVMLQSSDELLPFPMMKMAQTMMGSDPAISMSIYAVVACAWCAVYYFIARAVLLRKDW